MKIHTAVFAVSAPNLALCPRATLPEFAFIGRSNVGKSSLINLLTQKKDLARVSDLPGKTKLINFFTINSAWTLVDLPGYGYAKVAKTDRQEFSTAVRTFLRERATLVCTFVLIDSRHEPQEMDLKFVHWMGTHALPFALVFTKIDKQSAQQSRNRIDQFRQAMAQSTDARPLIFASSATTKAGRDDILAFIAKSMPDKKSSKDFTLAPMMTHPDRSPDTAAASPWVAEEDEQTDTEDAAE